MIDAETIVRAVLPVYLMMLAGALARRTGLLKREADVWLMGLTVNILFPCLILDKMLGNPALQHTSTLLWAASTGALGIAAGLGLALLGGRWLGLQKGSGLRTFALTTGLQNYGFIAIPVLAAVFPGKGPMGVLFLHNLGVELAMWSLGLMLLSGAWAGFWRVLKNGPILAVLAGVVLVKSGAESLVPGPLHTVIGEFGSGAVPLSLLLVGMTMSDLMFAERPAWKVALGSVVLRLGLLAFLLLCAAKFLPVPKELKMVLIVQAAMPAAVFPIVLARHYGGSPAMAIQVVVATGLAALLTIPFTVAWGARWVLGTG